jgi:Tol biopolymer transport system component
MKTGIFLSWRRWRGGVMGSKRRSSMLVVLAILAGVIGLSGTARGTFPGKNGRIAFVEGNDVYTMNPDGSDERQLTSVGPNNSTSNPAWSPDGRQLVFNLGPTDGSSSQLWIMNADGSNQHLLLDDPAGDDFRSSFSPDGSHVIFTRCPVSPPSGQPCGISRVRIDGTDLTDITGTDPNPDVLDFSPAYSPDGSTIAFYSFHRDGLIVAVYLMNADGSNIRSLTPPELGAVLADWSPNGAKLAFSNNSFFELSCGNPEIWTINSDGTDVTQLTEADSLSDVWASWAPEGNAIAFERDTPTGQTSIYVLNVTDHGASPRLIHSGRRAFKSPITSRIAAGNPTRQRQLRLIEDDGFTPRWGQKP